MSPSGPLGKNTCHAEGNLLAVQWLLADRLRLEGNIRTSLRRRRRAYVASRSAVWHGSFASGASGRAAPRGRADQALSSHVLRGL